MGRTIQIRVDKKLKDVLEDIRKKVATKIKKDYGLDEVEIHGTLASRIVAAQIQGTKTMNFRIRKINSKKGVLELE